LIKYPAIVLGKIWKTLFLLHFIITLLLLYPLFYFLLTKESRYKTGYKIMRVWAKYLAFASGIKVSVTRDGQLPEPPFIICPNHTSFLDILLAYCIFPDLFIFMGKKELKDVPVFNIFFKNMNILVDRNSTSGSSKAFLEASKRISKGNSIAIFPEGSISKRAPKLLKFKSGAFKLAADNKVPIVPVTFMTNWKILGDGAYWKAPASPGTAHIHIHAPVLVESAQPEHIEKAKTEVFSLLDEKLNEYLHSSEYKKLKTPAHAN
jgi:1-acyl-sn-glycerol-3-phosphate acyltransferase